MGTFNEGTPAFAWSRVLPPPGRSGGAVERAGWLTPYTAATIAADALHAGRGACLEMTLAATVSDATVAHLRGEFAWLGTRGVQVTLRRRRDGGGVAA